MKNTLKTSMLLTLIAIVASGCGKTSSTTNTKKISTSNPSTTNPTTPITSDPGTVSGCDGIYNANASRCYFTELPKIILSSSSLPSAVNVPVNNVSLWSSENANHRGSTFDEGNFSSDGSFKVRFKPTVASSGTSVQGRKCSGPMAYNWSKAKIYFMLRRKGYPITTIYETTANLNSYSTKLSLPTISGSNGYVLEVMGVETDHRCNKRSDGLYTYNTPSPNEIAACNAGYFYGTIPLVAAPYDTSCIAINVEFSTDSTYDLP